MSAEVITSAANALVKDVRRAAARGGLTRDGLMLAETPHLLEEAVRSGSEIGAVLLSAGARATPPGGVRTVQLPDELFRSVAPTEAPQGVIALVRPRLWRIDDLFAGTPLIVVLDGLQDPGNAGAVLRSAEAFGATGVMFLKGTASPYNPKAVRASAGSVFRVPFVTGVGHVEARTALARVACFAASARGGINAAEADFARPCAIVVGAEGAGVSEAMRAGAMGVRIPTVSVESLNAATAAAILLYEARRQRSRA